MRTPLGQYRQFSKILSALVDYKGMALVNGRQQQVMMVAEFDGYCVVLRPDRERFNMHPVYLDLTGYPHIDTDITMGGLIDVIGHGDIVKAVDSYNALEDTINVTGHRQRYIRHLKSLV